MLSWYHRRHTASENGLIFKHSIFVWFSPIYAKGKLPHDDKGMPLSLEYSGNIYPVASWLELSVGHLPVPFYAL